MKADELEMLKKAAQRAKLVVQQEMDDSLVVVPPGARWAVHWNPLENDGDAFRLLSSFKLHVEFNDEGGEVEVWDDFDDTEVHYIEISDHNGDRAAALRHAIVEVVSAQLGVVEEQEEEESEEDDD